MIVSLIRVTVPFRARALPFTVTALFMVINLRARIVPTTEEPDPSVAEQVSCQKTLHGCAPLINATEVGGRCGDEVGCRLEGSRPRSDRSGPRA
jgi:hypothetical protein